MPFTLCHPAMVIPVHRYARRATSLPALVIGSMMPDFVYFFSFGVSGGFSHSLPGIVLYCVPVGAALLIVYDTLLRQPLLAWLPQAVGARMRWHRPRRLHGMRAAGIMLLSLAIGAASHLAWDGFTHRNTVLVNHMDWLRTPVSLFGHDLPLFKILQQLSSLTGFVVLAWCTATWFSRSEPGPPHPHAFSNKHRLMALAAVIAAAATGGAWGMACRPAISVEHGLFNAITAGMATAALAILVLCVGWHVWKGRKSTR